MPAGLSQSDRAFLDGVRVAHLATADTRGRPHVVPVCFAVLDDATLVFAVDDKPKKRDRPLKRLCNLAENPHFSLVADRWDEDWGRLGYLLVSGRGARCIDSGRRASAVRALRERYPQYVAMGLDAGRHEVIELTVETIHRWRGAGRG